MKSITEPIKNLWALLTQFGIAQVITGGITSGALVFWSYIEGEKTSQLIFIAIATFCCVFVFYNSARLVYREYKQYPDYGAWDKVPALAVWHVACLWAGQTPYNQIFPNTKAYPYLQMLKRDIDLGKLQVEKKEDDTLWRLASRETLKKYAQEKGETPPFLFPDKR